MSNNKILITDEVHPLLPKWLEEAGYICNYRPDITQEGALAIIENYEGLIISTKIKVNKKLIDKAAKLQFIGRAGSGMDNIEVEYLKSRGIQCFNSPEGNRDAVGEQAVGMLLSLLHNINKADKEVRQYVWQREANRGTELGGKTVGIFGYGNTGKAFVKKLSGFAPKIFIYDKYCNHFGNEYVYEAAPNEIFAEADIVSLHIPLTRETRHFADKKFFDKFAKPIYFINTARGKIVDLAALIQAIETGKVKGAALDVLENEDLKKLTPGQKKHFEYLIKSDKTILTPHIAGWTAESKKKIAETLAKKILELK